MNNLNFEFSETLSQSFDDFNGIDGSNDTIKCHNCGWKWKVKDGGNDLYVCHKCNADNSRFYSFSGESSGGGSSGGADYSEAITQGVEILGQIGGSIAQKKASKEANKDDMAKYVDLKCGKDKSRALSKKKKSAYLVCKSEAIKSFEGRGVKSSKDIEQAELIKKMAISKQKQKNNLYIGLGVAVLTIAVAVYLKNKTK
jgi:uncharacterized protein (UPF0212 family)